MIMTDFEKRIKILLATALTNQRLRPRALFRYFGIRTPAGVVVLRGRVDKDSEIE